MIKKKLLAALLAAGIAAVTGAFALSACGDDKKSDDDSGNSGNIGGDIGNENPPVDGSCNHGAATHVTYKAADCVNKGNRDYWYCGICKKYFTDATFSTETTLADVTINPTGHAYGTLIAEVGATCVSDGVIAHYHCNKCGTDFDSDKNEAVDLTLASEGHAYGTLISEVGATCDNDGVIAHYHCSVCNKDFDGNKNVVTDLTIVSNGHSYGTIIAGTAATCTADGSIDHYHCGVCNKDFDGNKNVVTDVSIPSPGHTYGTIIAGKAATCTVDGIIDHYHCNKCGADFDSEHNEVIDLAIKASHDYSTKITGRLPTCTDDGYIDYYHCDKCGTNFDGDKKEVNSVVLTAPGHVYGTLIAGKAVTCEEDGEIDHYHCIVCNTDFDSEKHAVASITIASNGHNYGTLIVGTAATCTVDGVIDHFHCDKCGADFDSEKNKVTDVAITASHNYGTLIAGTAATCTENGVIDHFHCDKCNSDFNSDKEEVDSLVQTALGHDYGGFVYNYELKQYEKKCGRDETHDVITQTAGVEEYPYLISSVEGWTAFAAEHDEESVTPDKVDVYYKVTENLDLSEATKRVDVFCFSGTVDFDGHKVSGVTAENTEYKYGASAGLFVHLHDATIKNLDYEIAFFGTPNATARPVLFAWRGDILLENVTVSGAVTYAENSASSFVYFVWARGNMDKTYTYVPIKLTFKNCTNKANITNMGADSTSGYAAAFVGQVVANTAGNTVEFINCVNVGTITGYHYTAMLIANQNGANNLKNGDVYNIKVENCVNNGKIYAGKENGATLVIGSSPSADVLNESCSDGISNGANGVTANIAVEALEIGDDGNYVINRFIGATRYTMVFTFSVKGTNLAGDEWHGTTNTAIEITADSKVAALDFLNEADAVVGERNEFGLYLSADGENYVLVLEEEMKNLRFSSQPTVYLTAYSESGEVVGVATHYAA